MDIGDVIETAMWIDGRETLEQRAHFERDVSAALAAAQAESGLMLGSVTYTEKRPGEDRVPKVPDHIQGPDVRLLVAEAMVVGHMPVFGAQPSWFTDDLGPDDLAVLRRLTRDAYALQFPLRPLLTDRQCETIINDLGPDAALDTLRSNSVDVLKVLN